MASQEAKVTGRDGVLIIDDSDITRAQMVDLLQKAGMKVIDLRSPIGATRAVLEGNVGVVVVDLYMPGMRGDRLAALFRQNGRVGRIGIVMVSGESEAKLRGIASQVGADDVVSKQRLHELVDVVLRVQARARVAG